MNLSTFLIVNAKSYTDTTYQVFNLATQYWTPYIYETKALQGAQDYVDCMAYCELSTNDCDMFAVLQGNCYLGHLTNTVSGVSLGSVPDATVYTKGSKN